MIALGLPTAALALVAALGLPTAALGLPTAALGLPTAALGLPPATRRLDAAARGLPLFPAPPLAPPFGDVAFAGRAFDVALDACFMAFETWICVLDPL